MSRYDYIRVSENLLPVNTFQRMDLSNLEFQTKSLDNEFLEYTIDDSGTLKYMDYEYDIVETDDPIFKFKLKRKNLQIKDSEYTGSVVFYGKPYETMYVFRAELVEGKLQSIERIIK